MKAQISKMLSMFVVAVLVLLLVINYVLQIYDMKASQQETALSTISQIEDILTANEEDLENLTESLQSEYIIKAQMTAYIWDNTELSTAEEYQALADLIDVDEIHVFDTTGTIYTGSEPAYYGYDFNSGEQMEFFLPLLEDQNLTLCQDITPNTAEEKPMMYIATWNTDGTAIIQIGLEPERILEAQSKNELSYIFSSMPTTDGTMLFVVDVETGLIEGATDEEYLELTLASIGLESFNIDGDPFTATIDNVQSLCVFTCYDDDTYIGVTIDKSVLFQDVFYTMLAIAVYFTLAAVCLYITLIKIIDVTILQNFDLLLEKVDKIAGGDWDTKVDIHTSPEFRTLSRGLNSMVSSLLNTTAKMSHVLDYVDTKIAVFEYKKDMKRVFATRKLGELLQIDQEELDDLLEDKYAFSARLDQIRNYESTESQVYLVRSDQFVRIETFSNQDGEYGVLVDETESILEKKRLEYERDYDVLTEVYNRRAFFRNMDVLFDNPKKRKHAVIIALDMDNLKEINDTYGHDGGDQAIKLSAQLMREIPTENKIVSRVGGDEFMVVLYGEDSDQPLLQYVRNLREQFDLAHISMAYRSVPIKMSAGFLLCYDSDLSYPELSKKADHALYFAKSNGKNRFIQYHFEQ